MFKKGDTVKLNTIVPAGPILAMRMTEDGDVECLLSWTDADGVEQQRWFAQQQLVAN